MQSNIHGLCKIICDNNTIWLQLKTEIKVPQRQLLVMQEDHKEVLEGLQAQLSAGLTMEVDTPDLGTSARTWQIIGPV